MISSSESQLTNLSENSSQKFPEFRSPASSLGDLTRLFDYNISDLDPTTITNHKKRLYQLATFADITNIQIKFQGLEELTNKYKMLFGCTWDLEDKGPREKELFELINMIQSQSCVSSRKYEIKLVG